MLFPAEKPHPPFLPKHHLRERCHVEGRNTQNCSVWNKVGRTLSLAPEVLLATAGLPETLFTKHHFSPALHILHRRRLRPGGKGPAKDRESLPPDHPCQPLYDHAGLWLVTRWPECTPLPAGNCQVGGHSWPSLGYVNCRGSKELRS